MNDLEPEIPQGEQAYLRLIEEIRAGHLQPGGRLREVEIAKRFGLSRTPVREAIRLLEVDGIVEHQPRQGATLRRLEHSEIMELYEMRCVFEGTAARLAARVASDVELRALEGLNEEFATAQSPTEAAELNKRFHNTLLDCARNRFLSRAVATLDRSMMILGPTTLLNEERLAAAVLEHRALLDALLSRDGPNAEQEMRNHIEAAQLRRLRQMRMRPTEIGIWGASRDARAEQQEKDE